MAFLQPTAPRQPIFRVPAVVVWLIAGLAACHAARVLVASPQQSADWIAEYAFIPARYSPTFLAAAGIDPGAWWQQALPFVSYTALHGNLVHLAINSAWLLAFGPVVARRFGTGLFLLFFLVCAAAGAATHLALNWASPAPVIGASGAISGLMAAGLRLLPTLQQGPLQQEPGEPVLLPIFSRQILLFSLVWMGMNVIAGVTGMGVGGETALIAWQAHMGGFIAGMLLVGPFDRLRPQAVGVTL
jgi:membrane associated rhomboid family serine protease